MKNDITTLGLAGLLTRSQLAKELGVLPRTLRGWELAGMPVIKVRRTSFYDLKEITRWFRKEGKRTKAA